jgi:hypothetical protein
VFAIAVGWSLYQAASGLATFVTTFLQRFPTGSDEFGSAPYTGQLSWQVGHRVLIFGPLVQGLLELAAALAVLVLVQRRSLSLRSR